LYKKYNYKYNLNEHILEFLQLYEKEFVSKYPEVYNYNDINNYKSLYCNINDLDVIPYLFEMKVLIKFGKLLHYINHFKNYIIKPVFKNNSIILTNSDSVN
jgi:hypothetical protein